MQYCIRAWMNRKSQQQGSVFEFTKHGTVQKGSSSVCQTGYCHLSSSSGHRPPSSTCPCPCSCLVAVAYVCISLVRCESQPGEREGQNTDRSRKVRNHTDVVVPSTLRRRKGHARQSRVASCEGTIRHACMRHSPVIYPLTPRLAHNSSRPPFHCHPIS